MKRKHIHFVCRGNVYRSRIALLYALKKCTSNNVEFSCSGIEAEKHYHDVHAVSPLTTYIAKRHELDMRRSVQRNQTTNEVLSRADLIIFMKADVMRDARKNFSFNSHQAQSWDIDDWDESKDRHRLSREQLAEQAYLEIVKGVDELIREVTELSWVDIVDRDNRELGYALPISWASRDADIWHRSCHAIITTPAGYVVQKRAPHIILSPGRLDISVGGAVDAGETPEQAIIREIYEEVGLKINQDEIRVLDRRRWNRAHPRFGRFSRNHLTTFYAHIDYQPIFKPQLAEIAEIRVLKPGQLRYLLFRHSFPRFGKLNYPYAYYREMVKRAKTH